LRHDPPGNGSRSGGGRKKGDKRKTRRVSKIKILARAARRLPQTKASQKGKPPTRFCPSYLEEGGTCGRGGKAIAKKG